MVDHEGSKNNLIGGGTGMLGKKKKLAITKGMLSRKQFKERGEDGSGGESNMSPPP